MEPATIYFTEERWEELQKDISDIKDLLSQLLIKYENSTPHEVPEVLTAKQVSYLLGIDLPTIYARCANNMLPHFKAGKQYRFNRHEIMEWKEKSGKTKEIDVDQYVNQYLQKKVLKG